MGFLDGLRGGQYLGFTTQNVPVIDVLSAAPLFQQPKATSKDDFEPIDAWEGTTANWNNSYQQAQGMKSQAKYEMEKSFKAGDKEGYNRAYSAYNDAMQLETNLRMSKVQLESAKTEDINRLSGYDPNSKAWIDVEGGYALPVGFTGDVTSSLIKANNYSQGKVRKVADMNNWYDQSTYNIPPIDEKGRLRPVDARASGRTAYGVPKNTNSTEEILQLFRDGKTAYNSNNWVLNEADIIAGKIGFTEGAPLYDSQIWKYKTKNNLMNIETAAQLTYENLSLDAQNQERDKVVDMLMTNPSNLNYIAAKPFAVRPKDLGEDKTKEDAKNKIEEQIQNIIANDPLYANGGYEIQETEDGYRAVLVPVKKELMEDETKAVEILQSLVTGVTLDGITASYVSNKANNLKGVYAITDLEKDVDRYLIKQAADTNINIGSKTSVTKMNTLSYAIAHFADADNNGITTPVKFNFGDSGSGVTNIKLNRTSFGNAYTLSEGITAPRKIYSISGDGSVGAGTLNNGWKIKKYTGEVSNMPMAITYEEFNNTTQTFYNDNIKNDLQQFGLSDLVGGNNSAYNDFMNDPNAYAFTNTSGTTYLDIINKSDKLNGDEKVYVANALNLLTGKGITVPGTTTFRRRSALSYEEIKTNAYLGRNASGKSIIDPNNISDELQNVISEIIDYGGMVYQYKQMSDKASGLINVHLDNKIINQNGMYLTEPDVMIDQNSNWNKNYGLDTPYFSVELEYNIGSNFDSFLGLELNVSGIPSQNDDKIISLLGSNNYTIKELVKIYEVDVDDIKDIVNDEDLAADMKINGIVNLISKKTGGGLEIKHNYKSLNNNKDIIIMDGFASLTPDEVASPAGGKYEKDIFSMYSSKYGNMGFDNYNNLSSWLNNSATIKTEE